ncbi:MAG: transcriptional repressor LexA [Proteobacteria bacterium]|nr:transcriptional repressor LexA [Pseudomonadota bacterium]
MPRTPAGETRAKIHDYVCRSILLGAPPSVREIQEEFGFKSTATVREHLDALVAGGELEQLSGKDRGYRIPGAFVPALAPVLGRVHAGNLSEAIQYADGYVALDPKRAATSFALTVVGESMAGVEIHDGDVVLVDRAALIRNGNVVVALLGDEATIKTFEKVGNRIKLKAHNPDYQDIEPKPDGPEFKILGRVYEVRRQL